MHEHPVSLAYPPVGARRSETGWAC